MQTSVPTLSFRMRRLTVLGRVVRSVLLTLSLALAACSDGGSGGAGGGTDTGLAPSTQIEANGFVFESRRAGPADGTPVLLLHGFPQSSLEWEAQLAALGDAGYDAVAPDLRGYSPGARPLEVEAYRLDALTSDVYAIADALGFERFHVVGHDWGAAIAWNVAMVDPERILSLTAVSVPHPIAYAIALANDPDQQQKAQYIDFFRQVGVAEQTLLGNDAALLRSVYGTGPASEHAESYVELLSEPGALTAALNYYRALGLAGTGGSSIVVPTLYVWSTGDNFLGRFGAELTVEYVTGPYRFVVLEGVSHWVPEEAADELTGLLLEHLATFD